MHNLLNPDNIIIVEQTCKGYIQQLWVSVIILRYCKWVT